MGIFMQSKNRDQEMGNHLEILIVVIVCLLVVGFAGWRVYEARHTKKNSPPTTSSSSTASTKTNNPAAAPLQSGDSNTDLESDLTNLNQGMSQDNTNLNNSTGAVNDHPLNVSD